MLVFGLWGGFNITTQAQLSLNVTNFGARGDAVQFYVNTVSNSVVVTTTNQLSAADIGKTIQIFTAGLQTYGVNSYNTNAYGNQDFVGTITNVVNGTNLYVSPSLMVNITNRIPQATRTWAFATYGTDNSPAFSNAIAAANGVSSAVITIPNGKYLLMPGPYRHMYAGYAYAAVMIYRGGLHFRGESQTDTVLLYQGAWQLKNTANGTPYNGEAFRGFMFQLAAPITNDLPLIFENLTMDGGVQQGLLDKQGIQANKVDGRMWDQQHSAYLTWDSGNGTGTATHQMFTNVTVQHWRGEMFKTIDGNRNGNATITGCTFYDGNATAINLFSSWNITSNVFNRLFQIAEFNQPYATNDSIFSHNLSTNIFGNGFSWNGGTPNTKSFVMGTNKFYFSVPGANALQPSTGLNLNIIGNEIHCANYMTAFHFSASSGVGNTANNSNIVIAANSIYAPNVLTAVFAYGSPGLGGVTGLTITNNSASAPVIQNVIIQSPGLAKNVVFASNTFTGACNFNMAAYVGVATPMTLIQENNTFPAARLDAMAGTTNLVGYYGGPKYKTQFVQTGANFILNDSNGTNIPAGAYLQFDNSVNSQGTHYQIYPSQSSSSFVTVTNGQIIRFNWDGSRWTSAVRVLAPPSNLMVTSN